MTLEILRTVVVTQAALVTAFLLLALGHSAFVDLRAARQHPGVTRATTVLARLLSGQARVDDAVTALGELPVRARGDVLGSLVSSVRGEQQQLLAVVAASAGVVDHAVAWTLSRRRGRRLRGVRILHRIGVAPPDLATLMEDPWTPVRTEAARLVVHRPGPALVRRLIGRLSDPQGAVRFAAKDALVRCGAVAGPVVIEQLHLDEPEEPIRAALLEVLVHVADTSHLPLARRFSTDQDPAVRSAAARLAAAAGGAAGVTVLSRLLADPDDRVRATAVAGFGQLGHWTAAPQIARQLSDPAWIVRQAAGGALKRMGAPGRLFLRRALDDEDAYARDMARQVLDLPELRAAG